MIWVVLSLVVLGIWVIILHFSVRELERRVEVALGKLVAYQEKLDIHQSAQIDLEARLRHAEHRQGRTVV